MTTHTTLADLLGAVDSQGARALFEQLPARPADDTAAQRFWRRASHRVARGGARALLQAALEEGGPIADEARPLLVRAGAVLRPVGPAPSPALVQAREFPQGAPAFVVALADGRFLVSAFAGPWQGALAEPPAVPHPRREVTSSRVAAPKQVQPFGDALLGFTASDLVLLDRHTLAVDKKVAGGLKRASEKLTCLIAGQAAAYTGDSEGVVRRLDAKHKLVAAKVKHASGVHHLALSPDGARLASVAPDGVRLWSADALKEELFHAEKAVRCVGFTADSTLVAAVDRPRDGARELLVFAAGAAPTRTSLPFSPRELVAIDGGRVVIACDEGPLLLVELATGRVVGSLLGHGPQPGGLAWSAALGLVASTSSDGSLRLWDPARAEPVGPLARVDGLAAGGASLLVDRGDNVEFTVGGATVSVDVTGDELVVRRDGQLAVARNGQTLHFIAPDGSTRELELDLDVQRTTFLPSGALLAAGPEGAAWIDPAAAKVTSKAAYALTGDLCALGAVGDAEARVITRAGSTAVLAPGKKKPAVTTVELEGGADAEFVLGPDAVATLGSFQAEGQVWSALLARVTYPGGQVLSTWPKVQHAENANYPAPLPGEPHFHGAIAAVIEAGADDLAAVSRDGTLRVVSLAGGTELLRYDADNALVDLAAAGDGGFWAVDVSGRLLRLEPPQRT
ncbi:WD40 repeat domain-containing protein [Nannocystis pusilla]|uniref:WD40 repeat domain-containing protein n=1 Tax=Nannocystis pusilla TaxID=889268 RepID=UPI003BF1725D